MITVLEYVLGYFVLFLFIFFTDFHSNYFAKVLIYNMHLFYVFTTDCDKC